MDKQKARRYRRAFSFLCGIKNNESEFTLTMRFINIAPMKRNRIRLLLVLSVVVSFPVWAAPEDCAKGVQLYVEQDYAKAIKQFEIAAKKGDGCAQFQLGMMHFYGRGTKKDDVKAKEWFKKSAASGFEKAKMQLAQSSP